MTPLPYSPVLCHTPARPQPPQPQQQRQPARRSAAQQTEARAQPHSCQCPQEGHGPRVEAGNGNSSSGSRESCERE